MEKNILQNALNEFSQGTTDNIDSIMIKDAAGKQYWMKKADLATVLGGLLTSNKLYPYMYRGVAGDIDTITDTGCYSTGIGATTNLPNNAYSYGILEVFGGGSFIIQRYTPHNNYAGDYGEFTRVRYQNKWGSWRFIPYN